MTYCFENIGVKSSYELDERESKPQLDSEIVSEVHNWGRMTTGFALTVDCEVTGASAMSDKACRYQCGCRFRCR